MFGPLTCALSVLLAATDAYAPMVVPREVEFPFDDEHLLRPKEINGGKLFRTHGLPRDGSAVPLVIFIHGMTMDGALHHWLSTDPLGPFDARVFMDDLVDQGLVQPHVVAAPSQTLDADNPEKLFVGLDFDGFVKAAEAALGPVQKVDRNRIIVIGNSAGACYPGAASFQALNAKSFRPLGLFAVDGCMSKEGGELLARAPNVENVVVVYQDVAWERPFGEFRNAWTANLEPSSTFKKATGLRVLEKHVFPSDNLHVELVEFSVRRWLPKLLAPSK